MRRRKPWLTYALLAALGSTARVAAAQDDPRLAEARQAYASVDYESTRSVARATLEQGGNDRATTGELYLLWATAAAALDRAEEARDAFARALAVNPTLKLDRGLSPKIRAPYQEARGAATGADGKPPLFATLERRGPQLELALHDTLRLVHNIELSTRESDLQPFRSQRFPATAMRRIPLATAGERQFFIILKDAHDNVLFELGSPGDPQRVSGVPATLSAPAPRSPPRDVNATPYHVTAATLGALGLAAGGISTGMYFRREAAARDWNGPRCERPGATREQQCAGVDERRQQAERLAMGFGAASGALLIGGLVSLLLAPSSKRPSVALEAGPHDFVLRVGSRM